MTHSQIRELTELNTLFSTTGLDRNQLQRKHYLETRTQNELDTHKLQLTRWAEKVSTRP